MAESTDPQVVIPQHLPVVVPSRVFSARDWSYGEAAVALATLSPEQLVDEVPPWPVVSECYGHARFPGVACPQCAGEHEHEWKAWHGDHRSHPAVSGGGVPVRCTVCGARKCDLDCRARRGHRGQHEPW